MKKVILFTIIAAWLLIPTGTPDDVITIWLIKTLGPQVYGLVIIVLLLLIWHYKIHLKTVTSTMGKTAKKTFKFLK